ncbi:hypothetical protein BUN12_3631 [Bacillus amyloliquefaciens]|uniref:helix-turn-helix domain-containing protein n=1 Tax=Bacillus amyloliquefaciens TaxID=1390 RepID=UPI0007EEFD0E|nr:hypothetical protein [Bacillus amyloliquefaciens]ARW37627.1 Sigma-O factor regulatory protein RsoA [Bacillus amyloliquefaciens]AZV91875.1 hypothetical protein BUN12_3631 [Bacillus amyloliquefaciens]MDR4375648.1 hypothetical protein [Bacillus amyloliquefaciens]MEC1841537.1 hypothetical protein [Bacillus amyloliquefaciens]MEC1849651.1 hypothetical protein [Bacillus amyloliquefaciens]
MDFLCKDENTLSQKEKEELLKMVAPLIKKCLYNVSFQEREDFEQEIITKLLKKLNWICYQDAPGFWEFAINHENKLE